MFKSKTKDEPHYTIEQFDAEVQALTAWYVAQSKALGSELNSKLEALLTKGSMLPDHLTEASIAKAVETMQAAVGDES